MFRSIPTRRCSVAAMLIIAMSFAANAQDKDDAKDATADDGPKSSKEALVLYAEAASYQNNEQFDLAGKEWAKFVSKFAGDPRAMDARYNLAVCELQQKEFKSAVKHLSQVIKEAGEDFERLEDAYLNLGWCQYSVALENQPAYYAQASNTFDELLEKFPDGNFQDQALFFGGESLYLQGKFQDAADSYAKLVESHTDSDLHADAMYALGVTLEDLRKYGDAGEVFSAFMNTYPDHNLASEVMMRKAETILQKGDFATAADMFHDVAQIEEFRAVDHALYRHAFCLAAVADGFAKTADKDPDWKTKRAKGYVQAAQVFGKISKEMPDSPYAPDAAIAAGRAYYRAKEFESATTWFGEIKDSESRHAPEAAHWLARILLDGRKSDEARDVVASVMDAAQNHPFLVSLKLDDADALYQKEATRKQSVAAYVKIAKDHADHRLAPKALYNASYGAMEVGDYKQGLEYANQFNQKFSKHTLAPEVQKVVAECKLQLGQHDDAAEVYRQLADKNEGEGTRFEMRRGLSLFLQKKYDDAINVLQQVYAVAKDKDEQAESAFWLGRSFAGKKQYAKAVEAFQNSRNANPEWTQSDEVLLNLARSQRRTGQLDEAISSVSQLIKDYPDSEIIDQAHYRLGEFAYAKNDYKAAITHYTKVTSDWPESKLVPYALYGRGWSSLRSGDAASGIADFELLQSNFKDHELANQTIYARGMALHQNGDHTDALQTVREYLKTQPKGSSLSDALYLQGLSQIGMKEYPRAIESLESLVNQDPDYASIDKVLYELAWAHKNTKADDKAVSTFTKLISTNPKSPLAAESHYHLGENAYNARSYKAANGHYSAAFKSARTNDLREKAAYKLGWAHYQSNELEDALKAFDDQLEISSEGNLAADAEFMRGECLFKQNRFGEAMKAYEQARKNPSKNETMQVLTLLHGGQSSAQLKEWKQSSDWITELQRDFPELGLPSAGNVRAGMGTAKPWQP